MAKRNVAFVSQEEPSFIKQFKEKIGYKEGPNVDTKRQELAIDDDSDRSDAEDEKPQVVVLRKGDLTAEEAEQIRKQNEGKDDEEEEEETGRIIFKKPTKRSGDKALDLSVSSSKKKKDSDKKSEDTKKDKKKNVKTVQDKKLLSFDDEEDDDSD